MTAKKLPGKLVVVTDQQGRVVGAAMPTKQKNMQIGMIALDGQSLHEVALPKELYALTSPEILSAALEGACVTANGELKIRKMTLKK